MSRARPVREALRRGVPALAAAAVGLLSAPRMTAAQEGAEPGAPAVSAPLASPAQLAARLDEILADPSLLRAHVGLLVQVAETGEVLYSRLAERTFLPASNMKLLTGAVGLDALGPEYRWVTRLEADGELRDGALFGDLWILGGGDPHLTREELAAWPGLLEEAGIHRITGDLVGDDRVFRGYRWGTGWTWGDLYTAWGAGVSGLQLHPNSVTVRIVPGGALGAGAATLLPAEEPFLRLVARVRTGPPGSRLRLWWDSPPGSAPLELSGWIPLDADTVRLDVAYPDPTLHALRAIRATLEGGGIPVEGAVRAVAEGEDVPALPAWSAEMESEPFSAALAEMLQESDNAMAESILRTIGWEVEGEGSEEAGLRVVRGRLARWGVPPGATRLADGSGLSRYDRVTPAALARVLRAMWRHPEHRTFLEALPVAGVRGTLKGRLLGTPAAGNVRAKTGSLSEARSLSGYLSDGGGETLIFALLINGYDVPGDVAVALEDLLVEQLTLYRRAVEPGWPAARGEGP